MTYSLHLVDQGQSFVDESLIIRSAARRAPIIHNGTPFPGLVDAPVKYKFDTMASLIGGRKMLSWFKPCDRPKAAPWVSPYMSLH